MYFSLESSENIPQDLSNSTCDVWVFASTPLILIDHFRNRDLSTCEIDVDSCFDRYHEKYHMNDIVPDHVLSSREPFYILQTLLL